MSLIFKNTTKSQIIHIEESMRKQAIDLLNEFFKKINSFSLDGVFKVKPKAASRMIDAFLKLSGTGKILMIGLINDNQILSMMIARVEERPYMQEEKILYIDIAVTKNGYNKKGYMNQLISYAEAWALKKDIKVIELRTLLENTEAIRFWRNRGYNDFYIRFRKIL